MDEWIQLRWNSPAVTDGPRETSSSPYQDREGKASQAPAKKPHLPITDFVSQFAIGDNLAISGELLARSRRLVLDSKMQMFRARIRLLLTQGGKTIH